VKLRTQITFGVVALSFATFVAVGYVAVVSSKHMVRDRLDEQLLADVGRDADLLDGLDGDYSVIIVEPDGKQTVVQQPRSRGVTRIADLAALPAPGDVDYLDRGATPLHRVTSIVVPDGRTVVVATDATDVGRLVDRLTQRFWLIGIAACAVLGVLAWLWIRRSTRPIERLIGRAGEIAAGSPQRTLAVPAATTELRQLTDSLNHMVASIDAALAVQIESEARIRRFVADASHELRTPLTTISGYLQLDADGALSESSEHDVAIHRALNEARRMRRLVADLQLLTELDEAPNPLTARFDIGSVVGEAVDIARSVDPDRTYRHRPVRAWINGDHDQIRQVIDNLLRNTQRHTPQGTHIDIIVRASDTHVEITVADDGPGIAASDLANVFERFWRQDQARSRATGGSGLGLAIAASIVQLHHGEIRADATLGGGLTITTVFPAIVDVPSLEPQEIRS
jgi:two-component system, OmpR family, sensor kinase